MDVAVTIPNSLGTRAPSIDVPRGAYDAHIHIYDPRYPFLVTGSPSATNASIAEYWQLQRRNGTQRAVIVQTRVYVTDNTATLRAIAELGADSARGVAVISLDITDDGLAALHAGGIRGIRFSLYTPVAGQTRRCPISRPARHLGARFQRPAPHPRRQPARALC